MGTVNAHACAGNSGGFRMRQMPSQAAGTALCTPVCVCLRSVSSPGPGPCLTLSEPRVHHRAGLLQVCWERKGRYAWKTLKTPLPLSSVPSAAPAHSQCSINAWQLTFHSPNKPYPTVNVDHSTFTKFFSFLTSHPLFLLWCVCRGEGSSLAPH